MRRLLVFDNVTVDGFFTSLTGDYGWAHKDPGDKEWNEFLSGNASGGGVLVFGRKTYDLMNSFWPTPQAKQSMPEVAEAMNSRSKIVFSRTIDSVSWSNTTLVKGDMIAEMRRLKGESGDDMVILGSGNIVSQFAQEGLIDEYQIVVTPVVIGEGRTLFATVRRKVDLRLTRTRAFGNGAVLLVYEPVA
jgi:dihydrofolate reductase